MTDSISNTNVLAKNLQQLSQLSQANYLRVDPTSGKLARSNGFRAFYEKTANILLGAPDTSSENVLASKLYSILDKRKSLLKPENIDTIQRLCAHAGIIENGEYELGSMQQKLADLVLPPECRNVRAGPVNSRNSNTGQHEALTTANIAKLFLGAATMGTLAYALSKVPEGYSLNPITPADECVTNPSRSGEMLTLGIPPEENCLATDFVPESSILAAPPLSTSINEAFLINENVDLATHLAPEISSLAAMTQSEKGTTPPLSEKKVDLDISSDQDGLVTPFQNHSFCKLSDRISWTIPTLKPSSIANLPTNKVLLPPQLAIAICEHSKNSTPLKFKVEPQFAEMFKDIPNDQATFNASFETFTGNSASSASENEFYAYNFPPPDDEKASPSSSPSLDYAELLGSYGSSAVLTVGALLAGAGAIKSLISLKGKKDEDLLQTYSQEPVKGSVNPSLNGSESDHQENVFTNPDAENHDAVVKSANTQVNSIEPGQQENVSTNPDAESHTAPVNTVISMPSQINPATTKNPQTEKETPQKNIQTVKSTNRNSTSKKKNKKNNSNLPSKSGANKENAKPANNREIANNIYSVLKESNKVSQPNRKNTKKLLYPFREPVQVASKENTVPKTVLANKSRQNAATRPNKQNDGSDFLKWHTERTASFKKNASIATQPSKIRLGSPGKWPTLLNNAVKANLNPIALDFSKNADCGIDDENDISQINKDYADSIVRQLLKNDIDATELCESIREGELDRYPEFIRPLLEAKISPDNDRCQRVEEVLRTYFERCLSLDDKALLKIASEIFLNENMDFEFSFTCILEYLNESENAQTLSRHLLSMLENLLDNEEHNLDGINPVALCLALMNLCLPYNQYSDCMDFFNSIVMELASRLKDSKDDPSHDSFVKKIWNKPNFREQFDLNLINKVERAITKLNLNAIKQSPKKQRVNSIEGGIKLSDQELSVKIINKLLTLDHIAGNSKASLYIGRLAQLIRQGSLDQHPQEIRHLLEDNFISKNHSFKGIQDILSDYFDRCRVINSEEHQKIAFSIYEYGCLNSDFLRHLALKCIGYSDPVSQKIVRSMHELLIDWIDNEGFYGVGLKEYADVLPLSLEFLGLCMQEPEDEACKYFVDNFCKDFSARLNDNYVRKFWKEASNSYSAELINRIVGVENVSGSAISSMASNM